MDVSQSPNAEPIMVWNDIVGPKFLRFRSVFVRAAELHSRPALERHGPGPGARVLDVGCGTGETAIELARRVGPGGSVLGIDCTEKFLELAQGDAERAGVDNVRFEVGDAQTRSFEPEFDLVFARFGTMFFNQPVAAFRNLRRALGPAGRVLFVTWRRLEENPVFAIPKQIALEVLPPPPDKGVTCGPGPFSQADPVTVREMLTAAGFDEIELERVDAEMPLGDSIEEAMMLQLMLGPAGELVREAGEEGERRMPELRRILAERLAAYQRPDGGVYLGSSSWMITARPRA